MTSSRHGEEFVQGSRELVRQDGVRGGTITTLVSPKGLPGKDFFRFFPNLGLAKTKPLPSANPINIGEIKITT